MSQVAPVVEDGDLPRSLKRSWERRIFSREPLAWQQTGPLDRWSLPLTNPTWRLADPILRGDQCRNQSSCGRERDSLMRIRVIRRVRVYRCVRRIPAFRKYVSPEVMQRRAIKGCGSLHHHLSGCAQQSRESTNGKDCLPGSSVS